MKVSRAVEIGEETAGCIWLSWCTDVEVQHSMRQVTGSSETQFLSAEKYFELEHLHTQ